MFDIGWPELLLVMVIALVVIGPKDLPAAIRAVTMIMRKVRGMAAEFQDGLHEIAREAGVDEIKRSVDDVVSYDPKAALDNIAGIDRDLDDGEFALDSDAAPGNSILDPAAQSQMYDDDPDGTAYEPAEPSRKPETGDDVAAPANEDDPAPADTPARPAKASGSS